MCNWHPLTIRINPPAIPNTAFKEFVIDSGHENITATSFYDLPSFTFSLADYTQLPKFKNITLTTSLEIAVASKLERNIQLDTSPNHILFSKIYILVTVSPPLTSEITQDSWHMHSGLVIPQNDLNVILTERHQVQASESKARGTIVGTDASINSQLCDKGRQRVGPIRRLQDQIGDLGVNIQRAVQRMTGLDIIAWSSPGTLMQDQRLDTTSRVNEPVVASITQQREGPWRSTSSISFLFWKQLAGNYESRSLLLSLHDEAPSICASPKEHSGAPCIRIILFPEENVSQETCWHQGKDLPYHLISRLFVLRIANICDALTSVGNENTICPVHIPGKRFCHVHSRIQGMKRHRRRTIQKNQHIRTVCNPDQLTIRINAQTLPEAASEEHSISSSHKLITAFFCHLPRFTLADVHSSFACISEFQISSNSYYATRYYNWAQGSTGVSRKDSTLVQYRCTRK